MSCTILAQKYHDLFGATLRVMKALGGSGAVDEINDGVAQAVGATAAQLNVTYPTSGAPVLVDRMSWARTYLRYAGLIANPSRSVWILTEEGRASANKADGELKKLVSTAYKALLAAKKVQSSFEESVAEPRPISEDAPSWIDKLLFRVQTVEPAAFERLCQRLLRESGFTQVEVSGKSGDGGIDGVGVLRVNLISFQVLFQCKRWKGSVGAEVVRNFRGAMQGRADKGLVITTGTFTAEARKEATRDGAPTIDLIDGKALCLLLKDLKLGVRIETRSVEDIILDEKFFAAV